MNLGAATQSGILGPGGSADGVQRGNTRDNIRPVQLIQAVHGTSQFGRFGRPWKHRRTGYQVEGLVD